MIDTKKLKKSYANAKRVLEAHPNMMFVFNNLRDAYLANGLLFPEGDPFVPRVAVEDKNYKVNATLVERNGIYDIIIK